MAIGTDEIAPLHCPIPSRISPHADDADRWLPGWISGCDVPPETTARIARARFARYAGRLYPAAPVAQLRVLAGLFTWFFLLDDAVDSSSAPDPTAVRATVDDVLVTVASDGRAAPPAQSRMCAPMRRMLLHAWRAVTRELSPPARDLLHLAVRHHLDGVLLEAGNKWVGRRPGLAEYVTLRRATSAAYVSYALIAYANRSGMPAELCHHPVVRDVSAAGNDLLSWFNDLVSLERDEATAGGHNIVLATARERGLSTGAAVREVIHRWQERMAGFQAARTAVPTFGGSVDAAVRRYLDGVAHSVRGTIDWTLESPRYPVPPQVESWVADLV
jgi:hypothetical protein